MMSSNMIPRLVPVIVMVVPPSVGPLFGKISVILGCGQFPERVLNEEQAGSAASTQDNGSVHHPH